MALASSGWPSMDLGDPRNPAEPIPGTGVSAAPVHRADWPPGEFLLKACGGYPVQEMEGEGAGVDPAAARRGEWALLAVLAAVQFCHIMDFVIVMPLGPQLMRTFGITPEQFGLIVSAYTFSAAVSGLLAAFVMDRYDRKAGLLVVLAGFGVGTVACALAPSYGFLVLARVMAGAFGGVLGGVVFAIVGDQVPPARRGFAMGGVTSGFSAASVLGLPVGLFLAAHHGWHAPFFLLAGITAAVALLAAAALPPMREHLVESQGRPRPLAGGLEVLREPAHLPAYALMVGLMFARR